MSIKIIDKIFLWAYLKYVDIFKMIEKFNIVDRSFLNSMNFRNFY